MSVSYEIPNFEHADSGIVHSRPLGHHIDIKIIVIVIASRHTKCQGGSGDDVAVFFAAQRHFR